MRYFRDMKIGHSDEPERLRKLAKGMRASARNAKTRGFRQPMIDAAIEMENQAVNLETLADAKRKRFAKQQLPT